MIIINLMFFFCEFYYFNYLKNIIVLKLFVSNVKYKCVCVWFVGCLMGEELYIIVMILSGLFFFDWDVKILVIDFDLNVLVKV